MSKPRATFHLGKVARVYSSCSALLNSETSCMAFINIRSTETLGTMFVRSVNP